MIYKQCALSRNNTYQTSWIPGKFAKIGQVLRLKTNEVWEDGWIVNSIGESLEEKELPDSHKAKKVHRKNTGDSLLK